MDYSTSCKTPPEARTSRGTFIQTETVQWKLPGAFL
jgi:hypothetical protein